MEFGNGIDKIKSRFRDPFYDAESSISDVSYDHEDKATVMDAYRKKLCTAGFDDVFDSEDDLGEDHKPTGILGMLRKVDLPPQATQSILLEDDEVDTRRRSVSPTRVKNSQRKKKMSTTSQVFVKQSMLMNSPEKRLKRNVSFVNEDERKVQRTLDYYSPKKKTKFEDEEDDKSASGMVFSTNILSSTKDNLSDLKTQETQPLYPYQSLSSQAEKDEQEIIMSPVMSNILENEDMEKSEVNDTTQGDIISSLCVSEIIETVQQNRVNPDEVMFDQVEIPPASVKMYLAYHENSMCFYPCTLIDSNTCAVQNERLEMNWMCKKKDIYYYDLKIGTEVHYDRKAYKIYKKERLVQNQKDGVIKTDHLDNYSYELSGVDRKRVDIELIYLNLNDFCKVEDQLLKYENYTDKRTRTVEIFSTSDNSLEGFIFQFSDFDKTKEKEYTSKIIKKGGEVIKNEDIFEDKLQIVDGTSVRIVDIDKHKVPILLIENANYRVTKKLIEYMLLGWPVLRYDVVDRIIGGVNLEKNTQDFEEIVDDYGIIKNYDFTKFLMNFYGDKDNMLLKSTSLKYKRGVSMEKRTDKGSKFEDITSILLECKDTRVDLNAIKHLLFYL